MQRHKTEGSAVIENASATSESLTKSHADDTTILEEVDVGDTENGEASSAGNSSSNRSPHHLTELKFPLQSMLIFGGPTSRVRTDADVLLRVSMIKLFLTSLVIPLILPVPNVHIFL